MLVPCPGSEQCFSSANMLIASNSGKSYDSFVLYITNLFLNMLSIITEEKKFHMGDGTIGHTIQRHHSQRSKKNMPCCQNWLWRLICCFYRKNLGSKKRAHCPTWQLTLPTFLEISILFRHQSMCTINLFFRIQFNGIIFLIK